jgi:hypothetical protein
MSLEMGHVRLGRTRFIGRFFDYYASWLADLELTHTPIHFRLWATHYYCPGEAATEWEFLGPSPTGLAYKNNLLSFRVTNRSPLPWHFSPGRTSGIHGYWYLESPTGQRVLAGQVGFFERNVTPGQGMDLQVDLPPLPPGPYTLMLELVDEQHASFLQRGDVAFLLELMIS